MEEAWRGGGVDSENPRVHVCPGQRLRRERHLYSFSRSTSAILIRVLDKYPLPPPPLSRELGYHRWVREENFSLETAAPASAPAQQTLD